MTVARDKHGYHEGALTPEPQTESPKRECRGQEQPSQVADN